MNAIELHGLRTCPFAFRARLAAREKGLAFDWIPFDVEAADPRAAQHNPEGKSPLLWQDGYRLVESSIIAQYLDEAFEGPALQPSGPRDRAAMRLAMIELADLDVHIGLDEAKRARAKAALVLLERKLEGRDWLGGTAPSLADVAIWPFMAVLADEGFLAADELQALPRVAAYWQRLRARDSFRREDPYGVA